MNFFVALGVFIMLFLLGFLVGCFACVSEINRLKNENATLTEWLEASRTANSVIVKENDELRADIEAVVNGGHIITSTITADNIYAFSKEETK